MGMSVSRLAGPGGAAGASGFFGSASNTSMEQIRSLSSSDGIRTLSLPVTVRPIRTVPALGCGTTTDGCLPGKLGHRARLSLDDAGEAEVRQLPRVLIGGILPPGGHCYRKAPAEAAGPVVPTNVSFTPLRVQSLRLLHFLGFEHPFGKAKGIGERSRSL